MRRIIGAIAAVSIGLFGGSFASAADGDPDASAAIGRSVEEAVYGASFKNMKDEVQSLAPYKDKTLILYFWATWCVPCRFEAVSLDVLDKDLAGTNTRFVAIAMSNGDEVRQFVTDNKLGYTMLYGGRNAVDLTRALGNSSTGVPFFAIVKAGKVVDAFHGDRTPAELVQLAAATTQ